MKTKLLILLFAQLSFIFGNSQSLTDSLVAFYPFNGNANDVSINSYNATAYGAIITNDRFGNPNGAYQFDGMDDYIELPNQPDFKPQFPFSVSMWVTFDSIDPVNTVIVYRNDDNINGYYGYWIGINPDGRIAAAYGDGDGFNPYNRRTKHSNTLINFNDWFHIVAVFHAADSINLFINCQYDLGYMTGTNYDTIIPYTSQNAKIAYSQYINQVYFAGRMDEIAIWNRALSFAEAEMLCDNMPITSINNDIKNNTEFNVYPNPAKDEFVINVNDYSQINFAEIYDVTGKKIEHISIDRKSNVVNSSNYSKGIYFIKFIYSNKYSKTLKLIVN